MDMQQPLAGHGCFKEEDVVLYLALYTSEKFLSQPAVGSAGAAKQRDLVLGTWLGTITQVLVTIPNATAAHSLGCPPREGQKGTVTFCTGTSRRAY